MKTKPAPTLSIRAYARHRGVSAPAVLKAIASKRLNESLVTDTKGATRIADVELADIEWELNTDLSKAPGSVKERAGGAPYAPGRAGGRKIAASPLTKASTREKAARAKLAELEYARKVGALIDAKLAEDVLVNLVTHSRTKLLGVPSRLKQRHPELKADVLRALDDLIREALEELAAAGPSQTGAAA